MEVFAIFQLGTAARRGEAMNMLGEHLDFDKCAAYFPMTKNGRPRTVPLSTRVRDALERLPRSDEERVFPMTFDYLKNARSEEHTSELQSLMRISYAVFCLKKTKNITQ